MLNGTEKKYTKQNIPEKVLYDFNVSPKFYLLEIYYSTSYGNDMWR